MHFLLTLLTALVGAVSANKSGRAVGDRPNIVMILADDVGYADLGVTGSTTIATPNLDRMALEGKKLTQYYSGNAICTPSRAALMTGRLPIRSGVTTGHKV